MADPVRSDFNETSSSISSIVSFRSPHLNNTSATDIPTLPSSFEAKMEDIKMVIENYIFEQAASDYINSKFKKSNPFDSILLIDLVADQIGFEDINRLKSLSRVITDRSDEINFADGLDD